MSVRGVRGAISVDQDQPDEILAATRELLSAIQQANPSLQTDDLASAVFTMSDDLCSVYPAQAARQLGWVHVPLLCAREIPVTDALPHCIRVLLYWNTDLPQNAIQHVYLRAAACLRPDLTDSPHSPAG